MLLVNLGTPDATDYWSMRRYLKEFLSDRRVIEENRIKWWLILNLIILTVRPGRKGRDYDKIWNKERNEFAAQDHHARAGREARRRCSTAKARCCVDWAMRYGNPSIALAARGAAAGRLRPHPARAALSAICRGDHGDRLRQGVRRARDDALAAGAARRAAPYYDEPVYIDALAASLNAALAKLTFKPDVILASFHGMPEDYLRQGRSLLLPVRQDDAAAAREARARRGAADA